MSKTRNMLITGASAGIGKAFAYEYAREGWNLILTARREAPMKILADELTKQYNITCHIIPLDLSLPDAPKTLLGQIKNKGLNIDGLINNAGFGHSGHYLDSKWDDHARTLRLMLQAPCELAYAASQEMSERGYGRIINVASLAGHIPGSRGHTTYAAIKSFLIKLSQSLHAELSEQGVNVCALCPGFTYTEFHDVNNTRKAVSKLPRFMFKSANYVAKSGRKAIERGKVVHIPGTLNKGLAVIAKLIPEAMGEKIIASNSDRIRKD